MATRWRWRRFKLKYMKLSSVFHGFWWIFANFSMIFGILCEHFGTVTQCSVDPTVPLSETLKKTRNLSKMDFLWISTNFHEFLHVLKPKTKHFMYFITQKRKYPFKSKASTYFITQFLPKNANILLNYEKKESQQHPVFPGGHPSKYWLGSMLLNFSDRTRTGVFNMIWPLARIQENFNILFQQHTYIHYEISQFCVQIDWICPFQKEKFDLG